MNDKLLHLVEVINKVDKERKKMSIIALDIYNESIIVDKNNIT